MDALPFELNQRQIDLGHIIYNNCNPKAIPITQDMIEQGSFS